MKACINLTTHLYYKAPIRVLQQPTSNLHDMHNACKFISPAEPAKTNQSNTYFSNVLAELQASRPGRLTLGVTFYMESDFETERTQTRHLDLNK